MPRVIRIFQVPGLWKGFQFVKPFLGLDISHSEFFWGDFGTTRNTKTPSESPAFWWLVGSCIPMWLMNALQVFCNLTPKVWWLQRQTTTLIAIQKKTCALGDFLNECKCTLGTSSNNWHWLFEILCVDPFWVMSLIHLYIYIYYEIPSKFALIMYWSVHRMLVVPWNLLKR